MLPITPSCVTFVTIEPRSKIQAILISEFFLFVIHIIPGRVCLIHTDLPVAELNHLLTTIGPERYIFDLPPKL